MVIPTTAEEVAAGEATGTADTPRTAAEVAAGQATGTADTPATPPATASQAELGVAAGHTVHRLRQGSIASVRAGAAQLPLRLSRQQRKQKKKQSRRL